MYHMSILFILKHPLYAVKNILNINLQNIPYLVTKGDLTEFICLYLLLHNIYYLSESKYRILPREIV